MKQLSESRQICDWGQAATNEAIYRRSTENIVLAFWGVLK